MCRALALGAQVLDHRKAIELRQHHVHDRGVVSALERLAQRLRAGRRNVDGIAGLTKAL